MNKQQIKEHAEELTRVPVELIVQILNKHHRAMIEQMGEDFAPRRKENADLLASLREVTEQASLAYEGRLLTEMPDYLYRAHKVLRRYDRG